MRVAKHKRGYADNFKDVYFMLTVLRPVQGALFHCSSMHRCAQIALDRQSNFAVSCAINV